MATIYSGKASTIKIASTVIPNVENVKITADANISTHSVLGGEYTVKTAGSNKWSISFDTLLDTAETRYFTASGVPTIGPGSEVAMTITAWSTKTYTGNVTINKFDVKVEANKTVSISCEATGNGALTFPV